MGIWEMARTGRWVIVLHALARRVFPYVGSHSPGLVLGSEISRPYYSYSKGSVFNSKAWPSIDVLPNALSFAAEAVLGDRHRAGGNGSAGFG